MEGSHYMSFIAAVEQQPTVLEQLPDRFRSRTETFRRQIGVLMPDVPEPLRSHRIFQVLQCGVHAAAFRERTKVRGSKVLPFAIHVAELLDGLVGFLKSSDRRRLRVARRVHPAQGRGSDRSLPGPVATNIAEQITVHGPVGSLSGPTLAVLEPAAVAEQVVDAVRTGRFLVPTHETVFETLRRRAADPEAFVQEIIDQGAAAQRD